MAGLVEIPCIKRNASGVAGAFVAAELALAGIESAIPADEVIWTMKKVGDAMSSTLKETAEGGLAATPTGRRLHEQVFGAARAVSYTHLQIQNTTGSSGWWMKTAKGTMPPHSAGVPIHWQMR